MTQEVLDRFAALAGLSGEEAAPWEPLCGDAEAELRGSLREGVDLETNSGLFCGACAALAYYRYALLTQAGEDSFAAGDIRVTRSAALAIKAVERFWLESRRAASGLFQDRDFLFRRIP